MADTNEYFKIKATLKLKPTDEGGRKTGIISGYRPNHVFEYRADGTFQTYMGTITFNDYITIEPGEEKVVTVTFIIFGSERKYLTLNRKWWIHEGTKLVGEAVIIEF